MQLASPYEVGYKRTEVRHSIFLNKRRFAVGAIVVLLLLGTLSAAVLRFLANVPRERAQANFSVIERVAFGAEITLKMLGAALSAPDLGRNQSQLPVAEIYLGGEKLDALNRELPDSGRTFQRGLVKLPHESGKGDKVFKAKVRYRGDSINHWAMPQKSWRVELRKDRLFEGRESFNLYLPRTTSQVADYLGYTMGQRMGLLTPRAYPVHFRLNRRFDGTRVFLEQVDQSFLSSRNLDPWYIFVGDIDTKQIYGSEERKYLFHHPEVWDFSAPDVDRGTADSDMGERKILHQLSWVLNRDRSPRDFADQIAKVVDVESTLRYMALLDIVGSLHVDDTHNQKWYLDPRTGVLTPIVWDTAAYMWGNKPPVSNASNVLFRRMLQVPEFHARKNKLMWEAIHGPLSTKLLQEYVREEARRMATDIRANPFKQTALSTQLAFLSNEDWERGVDALLAIIGERNARIERELSESSLVASWSGDSRQKQLTIRPSGNAALVGEEIVVAVRGAAPSTRVTLERVVDSGDKAFSPKDAVGGQVHVSQGKAKFSVKEYWYPWGSPRRMLKHKPEAAAYRYMVRIHGPGVLDQLDVVTTSSELTGARVPVQVLAGDTPVTEEVNGWWKLKDVAQRQQRVLEGVVTITEDLTLNEYQDLVIKSGSLIRMGPRASIVLNGGSLRCQGTREKPIRIESLDRSRTWGVIALQGVNQQSHPESVITHTTIEGGSYSYQGYAYYEAALNVHAASLSIEDVTLNRSRLAVKNGEAQIKNTDIWTLGDEPVRAVNAKVVSEDMNIRSLSLEHPVGGAPDSGVGTPPREEREFRYRLGYPENSSAGAVARLDGDMVALTINQALKEAVENRSLWRASEITQTPYRASDEFETSVYRDIYIDSPDQVNYKNNISYRLRNRFKSLRSHNQHLKEPQHPAFWPYRSEFQGKVGRSNPETGLTVVEEGRFEFRRQSKPFSAAFPPPPPPWRLRDLMPHFQVGSFYGEVTTPGRLVREYLKSILPSDHGAVVYSPKVVLVTERRRQHLEIKTPWGTGPNPDQSFIITLDSSKIFDAQEYLDVVKSAEAMKKVELPSERGRLVELEMEFERNVSEGVAQALRAARESGQEDEIKKLEIVQDAFLKDQDKIVATIRERLSLLGVTLEPVHKSKFVQAVDQLTAGVSQNKVAEGEQG